MPAVRESMLGLLLIEEGENPLCDIAVIHSVKAGQRLSLKGQNPDFIDLICGKGLLF